MRVNALSGTWPFEVLTDSAPLAEDDVAVPPEEPVVEFESDAAFNVLADALDGPKDWVAAEPPETSPVDPAMPDRMYRFLRSIGVC